MSLSGVNKSLFLLIQRILFTCCPSLWYLWDAGFTDDHMTKPVQTIKDIKFIFSFLTTRSSGHLTSSNSLWFSHVSVVCLYVCLCTFKIKFHHSLVSFQKVSTNLILLWTSIFEVQWAPLNRITQGNNNNWKVRLTYLFVYCFVIMGIAIPGYNKRLIL